MKSLVRVGVLVLVAFFLAVGLSFGQNTAEQIWTKGVEHAAQGNFNEAKVECEKTLKVDPYYYPAKIALKVIEDVTNQKIKSTAAIRLFKGISYADKGQYDKAISDYTKAIEINPRDDAAYDNRGFIYMAKLGNKNKACSDWKRACELGSCKNYELAKRKGYCK